MPRTLVREMRAGAPRSRPVAGVRRDSGAIPARFRIKPQLRESRNNLRGPCSRVADRRGRDHAPPRARVTTGRDAGSSSGSS
jgi:hypothetical protein